MKIPILATGLSGLVGSRVRELLSDQYEFQDVGRSTGVDISDKDQIMPVIEQSEAKTILHMAAKTDVDACEDDKILLEDGEAWHVNVFGTQHIIEAAQKFRKRIVYISTDFVFEGTKDQYFEQDEINPTNWYGETKAKSEEELADSDVSYTIVRIAYPYRAQFAQKQDFVRTMLSVMQTKGEVTAVTDHVFTPTFIDDIATALGLLLLRDFPGIYHVSGSSFLSVFDAVHMINAMWNLHAKVIPTTREAFFAGRAFRPGKLALNNARISELGIKMRGFEDGLHAMKREL